MLKYFKDVTVHYSMTMPDGTIHKGTDNMKIWEIPKWLKWMSPPTWAPEAVNKGITTVITRIDYAN
jgi:hypothetical protein